MLGDVRTVFSLWVDAVARTLDAAIAHFKSRPLVQFVQDDDGSFMLRPPENIKKLALLPSHSICIAEGIVSDPLPPEWSAALSGSRAELVLQPSCFLLRPLELPKRASEFLDGIIRSQIDRLTPWNAGDAVYGWTTPTETASERIGVTIAATARSVVAPLVQAIVDLGASNVEVVTRVPGAEAAPVTVMTRGGSGADELRRLRVALRSAFAVTGLAAALSLVASGFVANYYDDQLQEVQHRIAERRAAIRAGQSGSAATALLEKRKQTTPSSVMVIEELSAVLPDHTYATELRIDSDKLQIAGVTHDAPSLIEIMERSPHFARATFFAPTTRAATDPGERFHIEAKIRPHFGLGS
jgi:general secretion pathway protein L